MPILLVLWLATLYLRHDVIDGLPRPMHHAPLDMSFIGFTGTRINLTGKNTHAVFGAYVSIYDIRRAVEDKAMGLR
jgi:type I restriction enzyme, R subunit